MNKVTLDKAEKVLLNEKNLHPLATFQDYYKLIYQDFFGPAHILQDEEKALNYLEKEVKKADDFENYEFQDISIVNNFVRVNLRLVSERKFTIDELFKALKSSVVKINYTKNKKWKQYWTQIYPLIQKIGSFEPNQELFEQIKNNPPLVSHSKVYKDNYHPHYRIISRTAYKNINSSNTI